MAYNKKNYYKRVIEIQELTKEYQAIGLTNTKIFNEHIKDQYFICKRTFDEYLGVPAKRELNRLLEIEKQQFNLFE
ncbi:hypothetical protein [Aquimarina algiphila]|uniref:Uncharacterized protein n=1 Tax=Aquimarina algiphila TaxID=2047982 RepID=A0A554VA82_9FLAO|nr:hypothetical protein [Aquimarina algiphila]TSE02808.1 hypothetical protein FOF46_30460 [Aquimarina algiphila]